MQVAMSCQFLTVLSVCFAVLHGGNPGECCRLFRCYEESIVVWIVPRMMSYLFKLLFLGSMHAHSLSKCFSLTRFDDTNGLHPFLHSGIPARL